MLPSSYMIPMRRRVGELFDEEVVSLIFSNVEHLYQINDRFYRVREHLGPPENLHLHSTSRGVAQALRGADDANFATVFSEYTDGFRAYSVYCNNHTKVG